MAVLLSAAEPLSVIMTTHKFLPFHRATTHFLLWHASIHAACIYWKISPKALTLAMKPGRSDLPLIGFPKTLRRFVCKGYVAIERGRNTVRLVFCHHGNMNSANT
jgi:hypothetical protein